MFKNEKIEELFQCQSWAVSIEILKTDHPWQLSSSILEILTHPTVPCLHYPCLTINGYVQMFAVSHSLSAVHRQDLSIRLLIEGEHSDANSLETHLTQTKLTTKLTLLT